MDPDLSARSRSRAGARIDARRAAPIAFPAGSGGLFPPGAFSGTIHPWDGLRDRNRKTLEAEDAKVKVLLSSVFGPFGVDDDYGRKENIAELFHNQITREQGIFSLRLFHQSFGLYFIAENTSPPTTVLDFPSVERFVEEIGKGYDYVGISFIAPNFVKARRMAELVREHSPRSRIVLGGHGVQIPEVEAQIPHDHVCRGEGVRWFRRLLGDDPDLPIRHPVMNASFGGRILGMPVNDGNAHLCPGVGCPNGCRFCSTSHFFGKTYVPFLETGRDVFETCLKIERELGLKEFFVMDENFLLRPDRAVELLRLMEETGKLYRFGLFSSADNVSAMGVEFLARLGVTRLWIGAESKFEIYAKNRGVDLKALIRELRDHGIIVIVSSILFIEQHDRKNIWEDIKFSVDLEPDFLQFMQMSPLPRTKFYEDCLEKGLLRKEVPYEEWHGQHRIWFDHPHFTPEESERLLKEAFLYDYDTQGSSVVRMFDTLVRGCATLARYGDPFMAARRENLQKRAQASRMFLSAARKHAHNERARELTDAVMAKYEAAFGPLTAREQKVSAMSVRLADREAQLFAQGKTVYQPHTIVTAFRTPVPAEASTR
jgi:hypothetical protein